ncbi:MAG TPA: hypothetical protein DCE71_07525 [Parachlamydiales bacterium]|nr:hypothetical protein [Parachlamydiales bacterium]
MRQDDAMAVAAAAGQKEINVHAGNRDKLTKEALLLLRESQELSQEEIDSAANACVQYLQEGGYNRALWVLNGASDSNDYGPFFKKIIIHGVTTSGQEVIGRLWTFINALPESEKRLALDSLVTALLNECINKYGQRICDQGKMQHLFLAILQGRLNDVQIDGRNVVPKTTQGESSSPSSSESIPAQYTINLFFENPRHREIEKFEEFIEEIKAYAKNQGIDSKGKEEE